MGRHSYLKRKFTPPITEKSKSKLCDIVSISALGLTITTGLFYFLGTTYYSGYLSYWGLPEELFSLSREKSIISGVFAYVQICVRELLEPILGLVYFAVALVLLAQFCTIRYVKNFLIRLARKLLRTIDPYVSRHLDMSSGHEQIINRLIIGMLIAASPVFLLFAVFYSSHWAEKQGKEIAKAEYNGISSRAGTKPFNSRAVLYFRNNLQSFDLYSGHLIKASATHCALYRKETGVIIFPLAGVESLVIR